MKNYKLNIGLLLLVAMLFSQTGCKTLSPERQAKNTIESISIVTDAAMQSWGQYVRDNNIAITDQKRVEVRKVYSGYQSAMQLAKETVISIKSQPEGTPTYSIALNALVATSDDVVLIIMKYLPSNKASKLKLNK